MWVISIQCDGFPTDRISFKNKLPKSPANVYLHWLIMKLESLITELIKLCEDFKSTTNTGYLRTKFLFLWNFIDQIQWKIDDNASLVRFYHMNHWFCTPALIFVKREDVIPHELNASNELRMRINRGQHWFNKYIKSPLPWNSIDSRKLGETVEMIFFLLCV